MEGYRTFGTGKTVTPRDTSDDFSIGAFLHPVTVGTRAMPISAAQLMK